MPKLININIRNHHRYKLECKQINLCFSFSAFKPNFGKNPMSPETFGAIGGNVTIPCKPEAAPVATIAWKKNGMDMGLTRGHTAASGPQMLINGMVTAMRYLSLI